MKNLAINLKNLCSGIGLLSLFLILSGYELKAESLNPPEKKFVASNKIKWVRYNFYKGKVTETLKKDIKEPNNELITRFLLKIF